MCGRLWRGFPEQKYEIFLSEGKLRYSSQFLSVLPLFAGSGRGLAGVAARTFESIRSVAEYGLERLRLWQVGRSDGTGHSARPLAESFAFVFILFIINAESKRFGGAGKCAQTNGDRTLRPICYSHCSTPFLFRGDFNYSIFTCFSVRFSI